MIPPPSPHFVLCSSETSSQCLDVQEPENPMALASSQTQGRLSQLQLPHKTVLSHPQSSVSAFLQHQWWQQQHNRSLVRPVIRLPSSRAKHGPNPLNWEWASYLGSEFQIKKINSSLFLSFLSLLPLSSSSPRPYQPWDAFLCVIMHQLGFNLSSL